MPLYLLIVTHKVTVSSYKGLPTNFINMETPYAILTLDKEEMHMLNGLLVLAQESPRFIEIMYKRNLARAYTSLSEQTNTKIHKMKWCPDPECPINQQAQQS